MSGIRSLTRRASAVGYANTATCPIFVDSADNIPKVIPAGTGSTVLPMVLAVAATGSGARLAAGSGALVSGVLAITTGLTTVLGFSCNPSTATGTGVVAPQILVPTWATGTVTVTAYYVSTIGASGALAAASGSSGGITWTAVGI